MAPPKTTNKPDAWESNAIERCHSHYLRQKKFSCSGARNGFPEEYKDFEATCVPVLMPGLWDCHVHFYGVQELSIDVFYSVPPALAGTRGARDAAAILHAGFTSVRELGGYGVEISQVIKKGSLIGPHIYSSVSPISMTAGHGDAHRTPLPALHERHPPRSSAPTL